MRGGGDFEALSILEETHLKLPSHDLHSLLPSAAASRRRVVSGICWDWQRNRLVSLSETRSGQWLTLWAPSLQSFQGEALLVLPKHQRAGGITGTSGAEGQEELAVAQAEGHTLHFLHLVEGEEWYHWGVEVRGQISYAPNVPEKLLNSKAVSLSYDSSRKHYYVAYFQPGSVLRVGSSGFVEEVFSSYNHAMSLPIVSSTLCSDSGFHKKPGELMSSCQHRVESEWLLSELAAATFVPSSQGREREMGLLLVVPSHPSGALFKVDLAGRAVKRTEMEEIQEVGGVSIGPHGDVFVLTVDSMLFKLSGGGETKQQEISNDVEKKLDLFLQETIHEVNASSVSVEEAAKDFVSWMSSNYNKSSLDVGKISKMLLHVNALNGSIESVMEELIPGTEVARNRDMPNLVFLLVLVFLMFVAVLYVIRRGIISCCTALTILTRQGRGRSPSSGPRYNGLSSYADDEVELGAMTASSKTAPTGTSCLETAETRRSS